MSSDPDPFDDFADPTAYLYAPSQASAFRSRRSESREGAKAQEEEDNQSMAALRRQIQSLTRQLADERQVKQRLLAMNAFGSDLEAAPNVERAAHSMARLLARLIQCGVVCIFDYHPPEKRFRLLASAGPAAGLVPGNFGPDTAHAVIRAAVDKQKLTSSRDLVDDGAPLQLGEKGFPSILAAPLVRYGAIQGLILLAGSAEEIFTPGDQSIVEAAAAQLLTAWNYARHNETLTGFVQSISVLSVVQEAASLLEMTASIAMQTLSARYVLAASLNQQDWLMRSAGRAPRLFRSLQNGAAGFLDAALQSPYTFRLQDLRKDERAAALVLDHPNLCTLLASPIRINGATTGILLAFGKTGADHFTDTDVFLAELLASQAAVNLESCYLNQELRNNLKTTQLLYDLSMSISQAETLKDAARAIARTAYRLLQARKCGLILFSSDGRTEAEVSFPNDDPAPNHPFALIQQSMDSRQTIYLSESDEVTRMAIPIQTMRRCYGALWLEISDESDESRHPTDEIRMLVNQAAVALERSILLEETRYQANEIARSYHRLESAYEDLLYGLTKALDARDGETEKHSWRVEDLSVRLGAELGLSRNELQALKRGALLHDIGKIGVRDAILLKRGPLDEKEWQEMRQHPQKGAQIIQEIPALHDALPVIAFHQERWDGSGYPLRLSGGDIPLLARIFSVVDVFDALTSDRPYRKALSVEDALKYLEMQAGVQFDPEVVARFTQMIRTSMMSGEPIPGKE